MTSDIYYRNIEKEIVTLSQQEQKYPIVKSLKNGLWILFNTISS